MHEFFHGIAILLALAILVPFYRVIKGPTVFDRLQGLSAIGTKTLVMSCLIGLIYGRLSMFVDITVAYAILSFIAFIAMAKYFHAFREKQ